MQELTNVRENETSYESATRYVEAAGMMNKTQWYINKLKALTEP